MNQYVIQYDVLIIGAGPAGLAAAIKLKQCDPELRVCVLEKGAYIGAHNLSGAVLDVRSLKELLPNDWQQAPLETLVVSDNFYYLTKKSSYKLPTPRPMQNEGNYLISLGALCQFLATLAEALGCDIYPGVSANNVLYSQEGHVMGVETRATGIDRMHRQTDNYQPGMHIHARQTLLAEGCRGHLSQQVMQQFNLRQNCEPQTYGLGMKEVWQVPSVPHKVGSVLHTVGWPLKHTTYGGSFVYHTAHDRVSIGFVVGLDYKNPWLDPFNEFQKFKTQPVIRKILNGGERLSYGARALNEGGFQSIPKLTYPGGALIGDAAGFLNVLQMKGIHTAIYSGMLAAETSVNLLKQNRARSAQNSFRTPLENVEYAQKIKNSWVCKELYQARNIRPGFRAGLISGLINAAFEVYIFKGNSPYTFTHAHDASSFKNSYKPINYPAPDGVLTFDRSSSIYLSNVYHEENQPNHLIFDVEIHKKPIQNRPYSAPESRYCPAGVYEVIQDEQGEVLHVNPQNCIHCKTCDIKDAQNNIHWTVPEGGGGPNYVWM